MRHTGQTTHAKEPTPADLFGGGRSRWRAAREVIDWSLPCPSIFTRKKPLSANTLKRIEAGLRRFGGSQAEPFIVAMNYLSSREHDGRYNRSTEEPLATVTSQGNRFGLCQPFVLGVTHGGRERSADDPLPTVTGAHRGELGIVEPFLMQTDQTGSNGCRMRSVDDPTATITTADNLRLVQPFLVPTNYGEREGQAPRTHSLDEPAPTVVGTVSHGLCRPFLVPYYGTGEGGDDPADPMRTLTARDRLGLVAPDSVRVDIGFRMLQPHELAAAMGFPAGYHFAGNRGERVKQVGNAVEVKTARALTAAIIEAMAA
jgi:DNA (cytosine-5)-methyltransferase 1